MVGSGRIVSGMQILPAAVQTLRSDPILILILYAPLADSQGLPDGFPPASMLPWFPRCHNDIASGKSFASVGEILLPALPLRRTGQMALSVPPQCTGLDKTASCFHADAATDIAALERAI